jgi:malonate transporter
VLNILLITFPVFRAGAVRLPGCAPAHAAAGGHSGLNTFVLYFALPCMLYRFGSTTPLAQLLDFGGGGGLPLVRAGHGGRQCRGGQHERRIGWNDAAFGALVAAFPNTGFMGVPLLVALLGARAAGPAIVTILVDLVITTSLCIALSRLDGADEHGAAKAARMRSRGWRSTPCPGPSAGGAVASWLQLEPIKPVMQTIGLLADSASPVALFTIGAVLARSQMWHARWARPHAPARLCAGGVAKLVIHPLLVLLVGAGAIRLGVPLDKFALTVMVLVAALPSASNVSLLAEKFGADNGRIARIILLTTAAAFLTFSGAVALLH